MASLSTAVAEPQSSRLRAVRRIAGLLLLFAACAPLHMLAKAFGPSPWPRRFLKWVARGSGVDIICVCSPATRGT